MVGGEPASLTLLRWYDGWSFLLLHFEVVYKEVFLIRRGHLDRERPGRVSQDPRTQAGQGGPRCYRNK